MPKLGTTIVALEHNQLLKCNKKNKWLQKKKIATNNLMKFYCPKVPIIYIYYYYYYMQKLDGTLQTLQKSLGSSLGFRVFF